LAATRPSKREKLGETFDFPRLHASPGLVATVQKLGATAWGDRTTIGPVGNIPANVESRIAEIEGTREPSLRSSQKLWRIADAGVHMRREYHGLLVARERDLSARG
jgi:hypothetical protein